MNDANNPYAAPKAPVTDIDTAVPMTRPRQIVWVIQLLIANWALGLIVVIANWSFYVQSGSVAATIFGQIAGVIIAVWIYYKIWQGRNWARIVHLVFALLGFAGWAIIRAMGITANAPAAIRWYSLVGLVVGVVVLWLLFFSPGKEWFRRRD